MTRYLIRRTFWAVWLFFVATFITYVIFFLIPSSPGRITGFGFAVSPVQAASINSQWHLDVPAYQQYWIFVWNIIRHQSLGYSFQNGASVRWILAQDARVTGSVVLGSAVLWILISLPVGILSALRPRSLFDRFAMVFVAHRDLGAAALAGSDPRLCLRLQAGLDSDRRLLQLLCGLRR